MTKDQIKALLSKYESGTCTKKERAILETWFLRQQSENLPTSEEIEDDLDEVWLQLNKSNHRRSPVVILSRITAAASIILALSAGSYLLLHRQPSQQQITQKHLHDIAPGGNQAILTLSNGQKIRLTDKQNGQIAQQAGKSIIINANGQLSYAGGNEPGQQTAELVYNTLTTPIGNQRAIELADGTQVTLDAGSSITYPVAFNKKTRDVSITGQVYFKVKHYAGWAFTVKTKGLTISDLGTEFNINAYDDEPNVKTTLISGSIKAKVGSQEALLKPGEQATVSANKQGIDINAVDTNSVVAWKNGDFMFKDEDFKTAMRQVARWYNVEMVYDPSASVDMVPGGWISRSKNISSVLRLMELTGNVHFTIEGRRIIVTK